MSAKREQNTLRHRDAVHAMRQLEERLETITRWAPLLGLACVGPLRADAVSTIRGAALRTKAWDRRMPYMHSDAQVSGPFIDERGSLSVFRRVGSARGVVEIQVCPAGPHHLRFEDLPEYRRVLIVVLARHLAIADRESRSVEERVGDDRIRAFLIELLRTTPEKAPTL